MSQQERWSNKGLGTGSTDARTYREVNGCIVYYSYGAIIGFTDRKDNHYMSDESWSQTTSKHQSQLSGLLNYPGRTEEEEFKRLYNELVIAPPTDGKDHTPIFG